MSRDYAGEMLLEYLLHNLIAPNYNQTVGRLYVGMVLAPHPPIVHVQYWPAVTYNVFACCMCASTAIFAAVTQRA